MYFIHAITILEYHCFVVLLVVDNVLVYEYAYDEIVEKQFDDLIDYCWSDWGDWSDEVSERDRNMWGYFYLRKINLV